MSKTTIGRICVLLLMVVILILIPSSPYKLRLSLIDTILGISGGISIFHVNRLITRLIVKFFPSHIKVKQYLPKLKVAYSKIIAISILCLHAILEEIAFRSYFLNYTNKLFPIYLSIIINSAVFAACHFNKRFFQLSLMGICFCLLTIYTNNILASSIGHITNNIYIYWKSGTKNKKTN